MLDSPQTTLESIRDAAFQLFQNAVIEETQYRVDGAIVTLMCATFPYCYFGKADSGVFMIDLRDLSPEQLCQRVQRVETEVFTSNDEANSSAVSSGVDAVIENINGQGMEALGAAVALGLERPVNPPDKAPVPVIPSLGPNRFQQTWNAIPSISPTHKTSEAPVPVIPPLPKERIILLRRR